MKNLIIFLIIMALSAFTNSIFAQIETNLIAHIFPNNIERIYAPENVTVIYHSTNEEMITIEIEIKAKTLKYHVFDTLVSNGRYDIGVKVSTNKIEIQMPNIHKIITVNNTLFKEEVKLNIYLPKGLKIAKQVEKEEPLIAMHTITPSL